MDYTNLQDSVYTSDPRSYLPVRTQAMAAYRSQGQYQNQFQQRGALPSFPPLPSRSNPSLPQLSPSYTNTRPYAFQSGLTPPVSSASINALTTPQVNLDLDFPALSSSHAPSVIGSQNASNAASLLSTYASQAGTTPSAPPTTSGATTALSPDDFPVLGGAPGAQSSTQTHQQPQPQDPPLPPGMQANGISQAPRSSNVEQTSAAAAMQRQQQQHQQHQQLLGMSGIMNSEKQPWTSSSQIPLNGLLPMQNGNQTPNATTTLGGTTGVGTNGPTVNGHATHGLAGIGMSARPTSRSAQRSQIPQHLAGRPATQVLYSPADQFGLLGLLALIRNAEGDAGMLGLGKDLNTMGLDMSSNGSIHPSFVTPWIDSLDVQVEPEFSLPPCYHVQPPPAQQKVGVFSDETLFYIFYSQPRDILQELAAQELYKHNWRYHKELQLWLTKEQGTEPSLKTAQYEKGSYIFFDPTSWEKVKRDFMLVYSSLATHRANEQ